MKQTRKTPRPSADPSAGQALRERAVAQLGMQPPDQSEIPAEEARHLLHELEVHQIELEMQNEELRRAQEQLEESRAKYFDLYDLAPMGYLTLSEQGLILEANLTAAKLLGVEKGQVIRKPVTRLVVGEDQDIFYLHRRQLFETRAPQVCELRMIRKGGVPIWVQLDASLVRDAASGAPLCRVGMSDISARKRVEEELRRAKASVEEANRELQQMFTHEQRLARADALTGLNNRRYWFELAEHECEVGRRYRLPLSVILIDIDHFKLINDTFGHAVGDQMLERVAQAARAELRSADVIGRYGGEEFVTALPMTTAPQAYPVAERIREGVAAIRVLSEKGQAGVTLSIGIAEALLARPAERPGLIDSVEGVVHRADEAMYAAKQAGGNRTSTFPASADRL